MSDFDVFNEVWYNLKSRFRCIFTNMQRQNVKSQSRKWEEGARMGQMIVSSDSYRFYCVDCQYREESSVKELPSDELRGEDALISFECEALDTCPFAARLQEAGRYDDYEDLVSDVSERWPSRSNCLYRV